jgi:hypothetical protein
MVNEKKPSLVFLMETKLRAHRVEVLKAKIGFDSVFTVDSVLGVVEVSLCFGTMKL